MGCWFSAPLSEAEARVVGPELATLLRAAPEDVMFRSDGGQFTWLRLAAPFEMFTGVLHDEVVPLYRAPHDDAHDVLVLRGRDRRHRYKVLLLCGSWIPDDRRAQNVLYTARVFRYNAAGTGLLGIRDYHHFGLRPPREDRKTCPPMLIRPRWGHLALANRAAAARQTANSDLVHPMAVRRSTQSGRRSPRPCRLSLPPINRGATRGAR